MAAAVVGVPVVACLALLLETLAAALLHVPVVVVLTSLSNASAFTVGCIFWVDVPILTGFALDGITHPVASSGVPEEGQNIIFRWN